MRTVQVIAEQEQDIPVRGNAVCSGDESFDRECENEILARLDLGDVWAWAAVEVRVTCDCGLSASDYLGACSYENESAFKACDYFADMLAEATRELDALHEKIRACGGAR